MVNNFPIALRGRNEVFGSIINIDNVGRAMAGDSLGDFIDAGVRLHDSLLERKNIAVKMGKKWKRPSDMSDCEIVAIGQNERGHACTTKLRLELYHRIDGAEDVAEFRLEFLL